jgi:hypothetical protein
MHSKTLKDWRAKRAGGRITVYGTDVATGQETKIPGVDSIIPAALVGTEDRRVGIFAKRAEQFISSAWAIAVDKDGTRHTLLIA